MIFVLSFAEPDIWMRDMGDNYEYIATYVDDLTIASRNPQAIIDTLESEPNNFKLKGTGDINVLLGVATSFVTVMAFSLLLSQELSEENGGTVQITLWRET